MGAIARGQKDGPAAFQDAVAEGLKLLNRSRSTAHGIVRDAFEGARNRYNPASMARASRRTTPGTTSRPCSRPGSSGH